MAILEGFEVLPGKSIVNSISLKEGKMSFYGMLVCARDMVLP